MDFEWDEAKREANIDKHGIDCLRACLVFDGRPSVTFRSVFLDEERHLTTGIVAGRFLTVVWTARGDNIRLISARRARDAEKRAYRAVYGTRTR